MDTASYVIALILIVVARKNTPVLAKNIGPCPKAVHEGGNCFAPSAHWQTDGVCLLEKSLDKSPQAYCAVPDTREFMFTLEISIRQIRLTSSLNSKPLDKFWIRGSGPGLSWTKPIMLQKSALGLGVWVTDIFYKADSQGSLCKNSTHCSFNQKNLEFRVQQDKAGKYDMMGPNLFVPLPISRSMYGHQTFLKPYAQVYPWFSGKAVTIEEFTLSELSQTFRKVAVQILFPPSFDYNVRKKYPGVVLFGTGLGLLVSPLLETMFVHEASINEAFIINIHYNDSTPFCSYNPYSMANAGSVNSIWKCKDELTCKMFNFCWYSKCETDVFFDEASRYLHPVKCGGRGDEMLDIIENHVISEVQARTENRVLIDLPKHRLSIIGYDGAGLLACHAAVSRPHVYQNAACMSPPFHWPMNVFHQKKTPSKKKTGIGQLMNNISHEFNFFPQRMAFYVTQKYYIDYGEMDNYHLPFINAKRYIDWFIEKLEVEFYVPRENILRFVIPRSSNNYFLHNDDQIKILNRIRTPLHFFLKSDGQPSKAFPILSLPEVEPFSTTKPEGEEEKETEEADEIPEKCLREFQIFQKKYQRSKNVPVEILAISIGE